MYSRKMSFKSLISAATIAASLMAPLASAQSEHWVATWGASPQAPRALPARPAANGQAAPAPAIQPLTGLNHQTVRMVVRTSIAGRRLRVEFSNAFGTAALMVGGAHVALRAKDSEIVPASDRALSFGGRPACAIPPGALMISDPVDLEVPAQSDLAVSMYLPSETGPPTMHG